MLLLQNLLNSWLTFINDPMLKYCSHFPPVIFDMIMLRMSEWHYRRGVQSQPLELGGINTPKNLGPRGGKYNDGCPYRLPFVKSLPVRHDGKPCVSAAKLTICIPNYISLNLCSFNFNFNLIVSWQSFWFCVYTKFR